MVVMWMMERRAAATVLFGIPLILSMLGEELWNYIENYGDFTKEQQKTYVMFPQSPFKLT